MERLCYGGAVLFLGPITTMRTFSIILLAAGLLSACSTTSPGTPASPEEIKTSSYMLIRPKDPRALLVLFPGFGGNAADTWSESKITEEAVRQGIAVMLMEFNRHLFLSDAEINALLDTIGSACAMHELNVDRVFLGGFSAGGNVSVILAKQLTRAPRPNIPLKGIFVVDAPLDLAQLYPVWQKHAAHGMTESSRGEGAMVIDLLDHTLGIPADSMANYETRSPVTTSQASVEPLKDLAIRLYTEPDTAWWRINRGDRYEDMNAYYLEKLHKQLQAAGADKAEFITTHDRGIQHGQRHPHAWSIVEEKDLARWVLGDPR